MKNAAKWADFLVAKLHPELAQVPVGFFDSFEYTSTGTNLTHPLTLGVLTKILWQTSGVSGVGIDVRLNLGERVKLQPDLVAYDDKRKAMVMIDYESPNSSDARVPWKDIDAYCAWNTACKEDVPYVVITSLPDRPVDTWELRYTAPGKWNFDFKGQAKEVRLNPFQFWFRHYRELFAVRCMDHIAVVNLDGSRPKRVFPA